MRLVHANRIRRAQREYAEQVEQAATEVDEQTAEVLTDTAEVLHRIGRALAADADTTGDPR